MQHPLTAVGMIVFLSLPATSLAEKIKPGYDLLQTKSGKLTLNELKGNDISPLNLKLKGKPIKNRKFGNTDTKLKRSGPDPTTGKFDVEMVSLSLKSKAPIKIGRDKFNAFVTLDERTKTAERTTGSYPKGKFKIGEHDDKKGVGTFDIMNLNLFLLVNFIPITGNGAQAFSEMIGVTDMTASGTWSHAPPEAYPTIPNAPAGNIYLDPFSITNGVFALTSLVPARVPVPATLLLIGGGLILIGIARKRGRPR